MSAEDDDQASAWRTLQMSFPPSVSDQLLEEALADFGPLRRCFVVRKKDRKKAGNELARGYAEFSLAEDAQTCLEETGGRLKLTLEDGTVEVGLKKVSDRSQHGGRLEPSSSSSSRPDYGELRSRSKAGRAKKARLIVRNLSFKASEEELRSHFERIDSGKVVEVSILTRPDGRRVGCAFVQMGNLAQAAKAIRILNGSELKGRRVAVDWAVGKKEYQEKEGEKDEEIQMKTEIKKEDDDQEEGDEEDGSEEEEDGDEASEEEEDEEGADKLTSRPKWETGHDVGENLTVFVRNLSFDSQEEDLRCLCEERFGPVHFAKLVLDRDTGHPRGSAFVKFRSQEAAEAMVAASETKGNAATAGKEGIWLDERRIYTARAITKTEADAVQKKKKEKEKKDSRNLHLAVEGLVRKGTQAAIGVSEADMQKRMMVERWKRGMLKDLNMFISPHRLCVRNLPPRFVDGDLRKLAASHCDRSAKITEAKVIVDQKAGVPAKKGSTNSNKGYGFVSFVKHEDALQVLRKMNNNPAIFGKHSRPIVEFSVENRKAVNARQKRLEKSRENNPNFAAKNLDEKKRGGGGKTEATSYQKKAEKEEPTAKETFMGAVNNPKNRNLPSHVGEKVRHNRPRNISRKDLRKVEKERKDPKKRRKRNAAEAAATAATAAAQEEEPKEKKAKKRKKKMGKEAVIELREEKKFTAMVEKYKMRLNAGSAAKDGGRRTKWFDQ